MSTKYPCDTIMFLVFFVVFGLVRGFENNVGLLSDDTVPESYALNIVPDLESENGSFTGQVDILISVKTNTSMITVHSKDLVLTEIRVKDENMNKEVKVNSWSYVVDWDQVRILMDEYVLAGCEYTIRIWFRGHLRHDGTGFFKSDYTYDSGKEK